MTREIKTKKNGTLNFILTDHLGSTSLVTDSTSAVINETKYKAWGEVRYSSGAEQTKYTYTGQYSYTNDFGLHFYNARWYDTSLGRFTQADSIISAGVQGYDRYAYVSNNPLKYTDPSGHMVKSDADGAGCSGQGPKCIMDMYYAAGDEVGMDRSLEVFALRNPDYNPTTDPELDSTSAVIVAAAYSRVGCDSGSEWDCIALGTIAVLGSPGLAPTPPSFSTDGDFYRTKVTCNGPQCIEGAIDPTQSILYPNGQPIGTQQGRDPNIRTLQSEAELNTIYNALIVDATPLSNGGYRLPNGGFVKWRNSTQYGPTIDINIPGIESINKIHIPKPK